MDISSACNLLRPEEGELGVGLLLVLQFLPSPCYRISTPPSDPGFLLFYLISCSLELGIGEIRRSIVRCVAPGADRSKRWSLDRGSGEE